MPDASYRIPSSILPLLCAAALVFGPPAAAAGRDCTLDGQPVNLDNGSTTAGRSGRVTCIDDAGQVVSEQELRDGRFIGFERRRDLWGNLLERSVNANGNTDGVAREYWPGGQLKSEAGYEDGRRIGVGRSFDKDGRPASVSFAAAGQAPGARLEFDPDGRLTSLQCASHSQLPEDREPCGFAGRRTTSLYRRGYESERVTYEQGRLLRHEALDAEGRLASSVERRDGREVRRRFHPDGRPATETVVADGFVVEEREWYMNGQLRGETTREAKERDARSETRRWQDDGAPSEAETRIGERRVSHTRYGPAARPLLIEDYDAEGHVSRRRRFDDQGQPLADDYLHPDGSRRAPPAQIGGG
jgi:antitoxin component YwqK of YwqJK toxin-antitoxin module